MNCLRGLGYDRAGAMTGPSMAWLLESRSNILWHSMSTASLTGATEAVLSDPTNGTFTLPPLRPSWDHKALSLLQNMWDHGGGNSRHYGRHLVHLGAETKQGVV